MENDGVFGGMSPNDSGYGRSGGSFSYNYFDDLAAKTPDKKRRFGRMKAQKRTKNNKAAANSTYNQMPKPVPTGLMGEIYKIQQELKTAGIFAVAAHGIQVTAFLVVLYMFPTHLLLPLSFVMSVIFLVGFLVLDRRFVPSSGRDQTAFRVATGYGWLVLAFLFSIVGLIGGKIFSCVGKKNCTTDYIFDMIKMYSVIAVIQGIILAIIISIFIVVQRRKMIEARKTVSIRISKPKTS